MGWVPAWAADMNSKSIQKSPHVGNWTAMFCNAGCVVPKLLPRDQSWVEVLEMGTGTTLNMVLNVGNEAGADRLVVSKKTL